MKTKILKNKDITFKLSDVFIMLINVKMPKIVGILTYKSMINFILLHEKFCTWVDVFRIIPQFRILRLTFHRKSAS